MTTETVLDRHRCTERWGDWVVQGVEDDRKLEKRARAAAAVFVAIAVAVLGFALLR